VDRLRDVELVVMATYSDMAEERSALTSWTRIDTFPVAEYTGKRVATFIDAHVRRFNPERFQVGM